MMNLSDPVICELLAYASNNNYCVELRSYCAVVDGLHGQPVYIVDHNPVPLIYKGDFDTDFIITSEEFKRLFAKR
ncbi:hypothetical protein GJM11_25455 [Salmonella enterica]|nr:hypothetical protein [Salmonella enterica]EEL6611820.1 hypothetical protein [Salmonella enterica]EFO5310536.1 hypothetical protein [Salmonella enterica]EFO8059040.1 hypothetical protein [Salmonella enterica]EFP3557670.1 hypothetical protein [Salmonella enterica]